MYCFSQKLGMCYILGDFFTSSSGHPEAEQQEQEQKKRTQQAEEREASNLNVEGILLPPWNLRGTPLSSKLSPASTWHSKALSLSLSFFPRSFFGQRQGDRMSA
jgi:hypothetical protein